METTITISDWNAGTFIVTNSTITVGTTSITYVTADSTLTN
jgi:hypothetical protein